MRTGEVVVVGLGEIGKSLFNIIGKKYSCVGVDIEPVDFQEPCKIMHICYSYQIDDFIGTTAEYIQKFQPRLTIINSTVLPGTTRKIYDRTHKPIAFSPIRGKHWKMEKDLLFYTKFIAGDCEQTAVSAANHFQSLGMKTRICESFEIVELMKVVETTYFGLLIAWAQEVERFCRQLRVDYYDVASFTKEIGFLPPVTYTPGHIGGHCIIPNIYLLKQLFSSEFLDAILKSNELKAQELLGETIQNVK